MGRGLPVPDDREQSFANDRALLPLALLPDFQGGTEGDETVVQVSLHQIRYLFDLLVSFWLQLISCYY